MTDPSSTPALGLRWLTLLVGFALGASFLVPPLGIALYAALGVTYALLAERRRLQNYVAQLLGGLGTAAGLAALIALERRGHGALGVLAALAVWLIAFLVYADLLRRYGPVHRASMHDAEKRNERR